MAEQDLKILNAGLQNTIQSDRLSTDFWRIQMSDRLNVLQVV